MIALKSGHEKVNFHVFPAKSLCISQKNCNAVLKNGKNPNTSGKGRKGILSTTTKKRIIPEVANIW